MFKKSRDAKSRDKQFVDVPTADITRSTFMRNYTHKTTFNSGDLIPVYVDEVLPGDTRKINTAFVARSSTPITPVMDESYLDLDYYFVPNRIIWDKWKKFQGENKDSPWFDSGTAPKVPTIKSPARGWDKGSVADHMGLPLLKELPDVSHLPFRAYALIWNEWYRDQNLQDPALEVIGSASTQGVIAADGLPLRNAIKGGQLLPVNKYHDQFTSALPSPQKAADVLLPLLGQAPVLSSVAANGGITLGLDEQLGGIPSADKLYSMAYDNRIIQGNPTQNSWVWKQDDTTGGSGISLLRDDKIIRNGQNLYADLSKATSSTINDLRLAFQTQKMYERDARSGTRYVEKLKAHFNVHSPDGRQQRPELLGSSHTPLENHQVAQTSSTDTTSPQGNVAAFSLTGGKTAQFEKSFTEHGWIIGVASVRTSHTYSQGINKMWSRFTRTDFYEPVFANIGEQPIKNKEIYISGGAKEDEGIFGYQEPWYGYRYKPNTLSGSFRPDIPENLSVWHYGDLFASTPVLGSEFITETKDNIDRTLAVKSSKADQFIADFMFKDEATRPMPLYSVPGMIDHN